MLSSIPACSPGSRRTTDHFRRGRQRQTRPKRVARQVRPGLVSFHISIDLIDESLMDDVSLMAGKGPIVGAFGPGLKPRPRRRRQQPPRHRPRYSFGRRGTSSVAAAVNLLSDLLL